MAGFFFPNSKGCFGVVKTAIVQWKVVFFFGGVDLLFFFFGYSLVFFLRYHVVCRGWVTQ